MANIQMVVWDVQHGNAIYLKTPNGTHMCFDIGSGSYSGGRTFSPLSYLNSQYDVNKVDYLVISHPHADHIGDILTLFDKEMKPYVLTRPRGLTEEFIRSANRQEYSELIDRYLELDAEYNSPVSDQQDPTLPTNNGGVKVRNYFNETAGTSNLNNFSAVSVISYAGQKIIIPGDIEPPGWGSILDRSDFKSEIEGTTILIASHHGRKSGFCEELFELINPDITIVSDGRFCDTSATNRYYNRTRGAYVTNRRTEERKKRYVLTTRSDYVISISIEYDPMSDRYIRSIRIG